MLRRQPTRVEDRADVAAEYEAYRQEKERKRSTRVSSVGSSASERHSESPMTQTQQQVRRQNMRARIGLDTYES